MIIVTYIANLAIALWNLARTTFGMYRPNGDGWIHSWFYCLDCLGNALAFGDPRETISSRAGKARNAGRTWGCVLCAFLGWVATLIAGKPTDHCGDSVAANEGSRAIIPDGE
ncbi:MAG TPA: hypothetical protein VIY48_06185 [Candidatus Paceibacterota bacterium]